MMMNMGMDKMQNMDMNNMQNMGMDNMSNMGGGASMNMGGNMAGMGYMPGMAGTAPGYANHGWAHGAGQFADPNAMPGMANHGAAAGSNGLFGLGGTDFLGGLIGFAVDILALVLVIGLIAALVIFIKRYLFDGEFFTAKPKTVCPKCGTVLKDGWTYCPKCSEARTVAASQTA